MKATVTFEVDFKTIKKGFVMLGEDVPSDEELQDKLKDPIVLDLSLLGEQENEVSLGFAILVASKIYDN